MSKQVGGPDREIEVKGKKGRIVGTIPEWNSVVSRWGISGCQVVKLLDIQECIDEVFTEQKEEGVVGEEVRKTAATRSPHRSLSHSTLSCRSRSIWTTSETERGAFLAVSLDQRSSTLPM